jgi:hypothetical protein
MSESQQEGSLRAPPEASRVSVVKGTSRISGGLCQQFCFGKLHLQGCRCQSIQCLHWHAVVLMVLLKGVPSKITCLTARSGLPLRAQGARWREGAMEGVWMAKGRNRQTARGTHRLPRGRPDQPAAGGLDGPRIPASNGLAMACRAGSSVTRR